MNDKGLWPITVILFTFVAAMVLLAIKFVLEDVTRDPVHWLIIAAVLAGVSVLYLKRR